MERTKQMKERFNSLYAEWEKVIQKPEIQVSSRPQDYINNEPYRKIVELGRDALPFILEKIEQGIFFMNAAALKIAGVQLDSIIEEESKKPPTERADFLAKKIPEFLSEQQKSKLVLKYIKGK